MFRRPARGSLLEPISTASLLNHDNQLRLRPADAWENRKEFLVVQKCANPVCDTQFRYLHQGKLFEVETQYRHSSASEPQRGPKNGKGHVELYWICDRCAAHVVLSFDRQQGLTMVGSIPDSSDVVKTVFAQLSGRNIPEISRVLIRPLDIDSAVARNGSRRTREAA